MKETIQAGVNYFLAFLGFISVIGVMAGIPAGIAMLISGLSNKDKKAKVSHIIWGIVLMVVPPLLMVVTLISFAMVNTILGDPVVTQ